MSETHPPESQPSSQLPSPDRYSGCLVGLAVGDAVGTTLEFQSPGSFRPITDLVGGGPFRLQPGEWTDDTSMALCLADSLLECGEFNPTDQMQRYVRWWKEGYLSSTGSCFDIGITVSNALRKFLRTEDPFAGSTDANTAGNGSLMRLAPIPLFFSKDPTIAIRRAAESSRTTHGALEAVDGCRYFCGLILGALAGVAKETLLSPLYSPVPDSWSTEPLAPAIATVANGSFQTRIPPEIRGTGYVVASLEAALWAFSRSNDFESGCLLAANLGDDADTTAAIYGQIAGAYYGLEAIPAKWRAKLKYRDRIESMAEALRTRWIAG